MESSVKPLLAVVIVCALFTNIKDVASCTLVNVARNKTVTMSSVHDKSPKGNASHAVNGINNGQWEDWSCTHTKNQSNPWLLLDLRSSYTIVAMQIVNRADCCSERLKNLHFTFGPSEEETTEIYYHEGTVGAVLDHEFDTPHTGQFLRISMDSYNYLTICEIELYGNIYTIRDTRKPTKCLCAKRRLRST